ncbi:MULTISPECIES: galactose ABC transporter substrate-binding protein [unclassified Clostridium]|uniref:galactose ABC transporter substrate-binding protein n=1 Tax=unclassified Clostridium TaxID=2614128 RepID=UPI000297EFAC|nr:MULTISPECIES: galactose ABC transporter substrate-binding protein [unclassified Clostridium]EKQ54453.1 MAG: ABC-type sugar transport system, periplasmic component [Clostridium sp. Maddingley MBC34-26]
MRILKRILSLILIISFINSISFDYRVKFESTAFAEIKPAKVSVFLLDFTDDFISEIRQNLEEVQKENQGKVEFIFYDGKTNQAVQYEELDKVLQEGTDLILMNIVDRAYSKTVIDRIKEHNIPVIFFNREPLTPVPIQSYSKALYIGTDAATAGELQGKMLIDAWTTSKEYIDKNKDNIMQYFMLEGEGDNTEAIQRTKYSVSTIEKAGIKTQQVSLKICNWNEGLAYNATKSEFDKYKDLIEVIISNDDTMAIGAIRALQEYGYNKGDKNKTIPIIGVDVTPVAKELIEKEYMLGSVYQDARGYADALYACGMNMIKGKNPVEGTQYSLDSTLVSIRLPHKGYFYINIFASSHL